MKNLIFLFLLSIELSAQKSTLPIDTLAYIKQVEAELALLTRYQRDEMDRTDTLFLESLLNINTEIRANEEKIIKGLEVLLNNPDNTYPVIYFTLDTLLKQNHSDFLLKYLLKKAEVVQRPALMTGIEGSIILSFTGNRPIYSVIRRNGIVFQNYAKHSAYLKNELPESELKIVLLLFLHNFYKGKVEDIKCSEVYLSDFMHPENIKKLTTLSTMYR